LGAADEVEWSFDGVELLAGATTGAGAGDGDGVVAVDDVELWSGAPTTGLGGGVVGVGLLSAGGAVGDGTGVSFGMIVDTGAD
jgi:hypothetical protein